MEKIDKLIRILTDELCNNKDEIQIDVAMKYCDMIKDLSDANYHVTVTDAMEEHGAEETVEKYKEHNPEYHEVETSSMERFMDFKESHPSETNRAYTDAMVNDMINDIKDAWKLMTIEEKNITKAKLSGLVNNM